MSYNKHLKSVDENKNIDDLSKANDVFQKGVQKSQKRMDEINSLTFKIKGLMSDIHRKAGSKDIQELIRYQEELIRDMENTVRSLKRMK